MKYRRFLTMTAAAVVVASAASAQTIEMIVPFSAGGGTDTVARAFAPAYGEVLDQTVIIKNLDGASGTIGANEVARARPDGTTLGYLPIGIAIQPLLRKTAYALDEFTYICQTTSTPMFLMTQADSPMNTVADVIKAGTDGRVMYGSSGPGTLPHLAAAAFAAATGINAVHLPFKGSGPAMNAIAGGEIQLMAETGTVLKANGLKPLAVFAAERQPDLPDVPTMAEAGYPLEFSVWQGVFGPEGIEAEDVEKLAAACKTASEDPEFQTHLQRTGTGYAYKGPEEFRAFVEDGARKNAETLAAAGVTQ